MDKEKLENCNKLYAEMCALEKKLNELLPAAVTEGYETKVEKFDLEMSRTQIGDSGYAKAIKFSFKDIPGVTPLIHQFIKDVILKIEKDLNELQKQFESL